MSHSLCQTIHATHPSIDDEFNFLHPMAKKCIPSFWSTDHDTSYCC
jgi:hypothetical protein